MFKISENCTILGWVFFGRCPLVAEMVSAQWLRAPRKRPLGRTHEAGTSRAGASGPRWGRFDRLV